MKIVCYLLALYIQKCVYLQYKKQTKNLETMTTIIRQARKDHREVAEMFEMGLLTPRQRYQMDAKIDRDVAFCKRLITN